MIYTVLTLVLLAILLYGVYKKNKYIILLSIIGGCILGVVKYLNITKEGFSMRFRDDEVNVANSPEIYCGDNERFIPRDYDIMGSRNRCLRKGVGIGMNATEQKVEEFMDKRYIPPAVKLYCGDKRVLPQGYGDFGSKTQCLRKGVGIGMSMPREKRDLSRARPVKPLGKREIMELSNRLRIDDPSNMSRTEALEEIVQRLV